MTESHPSPITPSQQTGEHAKVRIISDFAPHATKNTVMGSVHTVPIAAPIVPNNNNPTATSEPPSTPKNRYANYPVNIRRQVVSDIMVSRHSKGAAQSPTTKASLLSATPIRPQPNIPDIQRPIHANKVAANHTPTMSVKSINPVVLQQQVTASLPRSIHNSHHPLTTSQSTQQHKSSLGHIKKVRDRLTHASHTTSWVGALSVGVLAGIFAPLSMFTQTACIAFGLAALIIGLPSKYSFGMALAALVATMVTQALQQEDASSSLAVVAFLLLCSGTLCLLRESLINNKQEPSS